MTDTILRAAGRGSAARRLSTRTALLLGAATIPVTFASAARAQVGETVVLNQGDAPRAVNLGGGNDRVVVDIGRVDADTGVLDLTGLTTAPLTDEDGLDTVWLRATTSQARDVVFTTVQGGTAPQSVKADATNGEPFDGGAVYEASGNDTVLTLENRSRSAPKGDGSRANSLMDLRYGPLRLAGDGTVVVSFSLDVQNQPDGVPDQAIYVESGSTLDGQGGDGKLSVIVNSDVTGGVTTGLIDVSNAASLRLTRNEEANGSARVSIASGTAIVGGDADIVLDPNTWVNSTNARATDVTLIRSSGKVINSAKISVGGANGGGRGGTGVLLEGGKLYNIVTDNPRGDGPASGGIGTIYGGSSAVLAEGEFGNYIENTGIISTTIGAAIENQGQTLVTRNMIHRYGNGGTRAGEIVGGVVAQIPFAGVAPSNKLAYYNDGISTDVLVNSGKVDGNVLFGGGNSMFLYTGDTNGVIGQIDGGDGTDAYGKSFSASATYVLSQLILTQSGISGFEMHGVEASGANTTVTVTAGDVVDAGLMLIGDGTVANTANITTDGIGVWTRQIDNITGGMKFINRGLIASRADYGFLGENLSSFVNEGTIRSGAYSAVYIEAGKDGRGPAFQFGNQGLIESSSLRDSAVVLSFQSQGTSDLVADVTNSGTIRHLGFLEHTNDEGQYALVMQTDLERELGENYRMRATNTGTIEATGKGFSGMLMRGHKLDLVNENIIRATGAAGGGAHFRTNTDGVRPRTLASLVNRGTISGGTGAILDDESNTARIAYGAIFDFSPTNAGGEASVVNEGTIEVGAEGVAIGVDGGMNQDSAFTLDNRGTIRGGAGYTLAGDLYLETANLLRDGERTVAGAIHTRNSVDSITNRGTIIGAVDLGDLNDTLANYGALNGNIALGGDQDTYITGSGASLTGMVDGAADNDLIKVDLTGADAKKINASQFKNFETLTALDGTSGTGTVSIFGDIDQAFWRLRAISLQIDAGDTVRSASRGDGYTFEGADATSVTITNAGTIEGGVSMGAGDDTLSNSGSIGFAVDMNSGDDTVTNSGIIHGAAALGIGNDVVTNSGTVGYVDLGSGDDTIINSGTIEELDGDAGNDRLELLAGGRVNGRVDMGLDDDTVLNSGTIDGNLALGGGNDRYVAQSGGVVTGTIDGGEGTDTFVFRLNGNNGTIPGGFANFESFGAYGPGTLTLALDQDYHTIELFETANLTLTGGTGTVDQITGDDSAQVVAINDEDFRGGVSLAGGNDTLALQLNGALAGALDGGIGTDTLKLNLTGASSINDLFNFEVVDVAGASPLTLTGTLGAGQRINFDGSDNRFIVDTGATFAGIANGGAGTDTLEINTGAANSRTIVAGQVLSFEKLVAGGQGTLALNGESYTFESVDVEGNLSIGDGASLASGSGVKFGNGANRLTLEGTGAVTSPVDGGAGNDTIAVNLTAGQTRNHSTLGALTSFETLAASGAGTLNIDQNATYQGVSVEGGHLNILTGATLAAPVAGGGAADRLTVAAGGAVTGDVALGGGDDVVTNAGTITGDISLGEGNDRYVAQAGGVVTGTIDGGAGDNTFVFRLEGSQGNIPGSVLNFNSFGAYGPGTLTVNLDQGQTYQNLEILEGANLVLSGTNGTVANVIGDDSAQSVTIDGVLTGGVALGEGNDSLTMQLSGLLEGALDGGAGTDTLNLTLTGASSIAGMFGFEIANITGASPLTLAGDLGSNQQVNFTGDADNELVIAAGTRFEGTVNGGAGHDMLRVQSGNAENRTVVASQIVSFEDVVSEGAGTLALTGGTYIFETLAVNGGSLELGANTRLDAADGVTFDGADNRFTLGSGAMVSGRIDGGAGNDVLALVQAAGTTRLLSGIDQTGFERLEASGSGNGELRIDRNAIFVNGVGIDGGIFNVTASNTLTASVVGGANRDTVIVGGRVEGDLDLGAGDDFLTIAGAGAITGTRSGGDGTDTLVFNTSSTYAAPTLFDATAYSSFEGLNVEGGVVSFTGTGSYAAINIAGGRLIGQAGSVISANSPIQVARGATFGSAGRVNGDILVSGTLSPGASPGTMTVNGNVAFLTGSNLLLEVSPTVSDLLNISGTLTIGTGATLDITGVLNGTPGNRLDLVVAQGGITGRFTTINKSNTIFGFVVQNGNRLQIQSEFLGGDYPTNIEASIDYANEVLREGYGVHAFTAALPMLVDAQGTINQQAFAQLTPEAYGSAVQLGEENSLLIVDGVHSAIATKAEQEGLYSFGQFLVGRADVEATNGLSGASASRITNRGFFGGIGYGLGGGTQIGAFAGGLSSKQTIRWLGVKTEINTLAGGVFADASFGSLGLHGLVGVNAGKAETKRNLIVREGTGKAKYDLTSWVADVGIDYQVKFGPWAITPRLGVTYVRTSRGAALEEGLGDFGLTVDKGSRDSWFGEAAVALSGNFDLGGTKLRPYAQFGVRRLLGDPGVLVSGHYTGADSSIVVNGVEREGAAMRVALGLGLDLTEGVRLQAGYTGEFAGTKRNSVMGGFSVRF